MREIPEPSGVAYHPKRDSLFVVGDEGLLAEVSLDGKVLRTRMLGGDLEGVTCDVEGGRLYVVREGADEIVELRDEDLSTVRKVGVDRGFDGDKNFLKRGGDGLEGIAYRPPSVPGARGRLFAVNQYDPPALIELDYPFDDPGARTATIRNAWLVKGAPLSDLFWDAKIDAFVVVSALWRKAYVLGADGRIVRGVPLPGIMQEGLARLPDDSFLLVQDTGGLLKWKPLHDPFSLQTDQAHGANGGSAPQDDEL